MKTKHVERPSSQQRQEMIAIAAYYLAEQRGFVPGGAEADWFHAERVIDAMIADRRLKRTMGHDAGRATIRNALLLQDETELA